MTDSLKIKFDELSLKINSETNQIQKQKFAQEQIEILKQIQQNFLIEAEKRGYALTSYNVLDIKLQQYKLMKQIAITNNLQFEEYENLIQKTEKEIFGEQFFTHLPAIIQHDFKSYFVNPKIGIKKVNFCKHKFSLIGMGGMGNCKYFYTFVYLQKRLESLL